MNQLATKFKYRSDSFLELPLDTLNIEISENVNTKMIIWCYGFSRESEGSFQYGNYHREIDDLRAVIQHFHWEKRVITAIVGHSKGVLIIHVQSLGFYL